MKRHALQKRGQPQTYYVDIGVNVGIRIIAAAYPAIGELFGLQNGINILRRFFRLRPGYCVGPAIEVGNVPPGNRPDVTGFQAEQPIGVSDHFCVLSQVAHQCLATDHDSFRESKYEWHPTVWATCKYSSHPAAFLEESMACFRCYSGRGACNWRS